MAKVTSSKMLPKKRNPALIQSVMRFHTVCLVLLQVLALKIIRPNFLSIVSMQVKILEFSLVELFKMSF